MARWPDVTVCDTCGAIGTVSSYKEGVPPHVVEYSNGTKWTWKFRDEPQWCPSCYDIRRKEQFRNVSYPAQVPSDRPSSAGPAASSAGRSTRR